MMCRLHARPAPSANVNIRKLHNVSRLAFAGWVGQAALDYFIFATFARPAVADFPMISFVSPCSFHRNAFNGFQFCVQFERRYPTAREFPCTNMRAGVFVNGVVETWIVVRVLVKAILK